MYPALQYIFNKNNFQSKSIGMIAKDLYIKQVMTRKSNIQYKNN